MSSLQFSFDIGYASIGWSVIKSLTNQDNPEIIAAGTVLFPKDDCLASHRRDYRRLRRNTRSTRQRMERINKLLISVGILPNDIDLEQGHMAPFFLATQVLKKGKILTAEELWQVLKWYGHNRGYDGNSQWSRQDEDNEDAERVKAAKNLMQQYGTDTMAETVCRILQLDISKDQPNFTDQTPAYKTLNIAFPRNVVVEEATQIIKSHINQIPGLSEEIANLLIQSGDLSSEQREFLKTKGIAYLPKRYRGNLLFGQLIPRFDNRIIKRCPLTWAQIYQTAISEGKTEKVAKAQAEKLSKVAQANTKSFYEYRFARLLANIRVKGLPLNATLRRKIFELAKQLGKLTAKDIIETIEKDHEKGVDTNIINMFTLHPDSEEALVLCPATACAKSNQLFKEVYPQLPHFIQKMILKTLNKGSVTTLAKIKQLLEHYSEDTNWLENLVLQKAKSELNKSKKSKKESTPNTLEGITQTLWNKTIKAPTASGRAPYSQTILRQVLDEVLEGYDPNSPAHSEQHPQGETKEKDGVLYPLLDPNSSVRQLQNERDLSDLTNNHLIRHRLLIMERLIKDMVKEFAQDDPNKVTHTIIEVTREVSKFSGMTAEEIATELNARNRDFKKASDYLQKNYTGEITGGLIRKCRIAMDMNWTCPFTGKKYDAIHLPQMEKEHIVPFSKRNTHSLSALVLTYPEVNKMKGARTALEFIKESQNTSVPGKPELSIMTEKLYKDLVNKLDIKGHKDDEKRKKARKRLLLIDKIANKKKSATVEDNEDQDLGFTEGALTQSSHLIKLAIKSLQTLLPSSQYLTIPGAVTSEIKKAWKLTGCLAQACPEILDANTGKPKLKDDIRGITDLHHALDALTIGLTQHYLSAGNNGTAWKAILKRSMKNSIIDPDDHMKKVIYKVRSGNNQLQLLDLPSQVKNTIAKALNEKRIVQHIPSDQSGAKLDETIRRVISTESKNGKVMISLAQKKSRVENGKRIKTLKTDEKKPSMLIGINPTGKSKLKKIKGAIVINENYGIALDPTPTMIPHFQVHQKLMDLKEKNGGKPVRILRKGMQINIKNPKKPEKDGIWVIRSIKDSSRDGLLINLQRKELNMNIENKNIKNWRDVRVSTLLNHFFEILNQPYTGTPS